MSIRMALVGNPNCDKTTMFNAMTGANQYVGNWPGVTVEKKEGKLKGHPDVTVTDLPGIYSLSPYTLEEVVSRNYLLNEHPDVIINLVDATNIERNLYLTTQVLELGIPVVVALNMMDVIKKRGDQINSIKLSEKLGCPVIEVSALRGSGLKELYNKAIEVASLKEPFRPVHSFQKRVEQALEVNENNISGHVDASQLRWYAIKLFEKDEKVLASLEGRMKLPAEIQETIAACEEELDDDGESIITNERYQYITSIIGSVVKKARTGLTPSDRIDQIVTNRILALPIFVVIMALVYAISMGSWTVSIGTKATDWANDGLFGDGWFVPFTADTEAWEEASGAHEEANTVIEGFLAAAEKAGVDTSEFTAAREDGTLDDAMIQAFAAQTADLTTDVYFYDDETGVTTTETVDLSHFEEALTVEEPDPNEYGTWVPGIPVLVENLLNSIGCNEVQAQIEIGFEKFLEEKNYQAIVTHFGDLGALKQLPGLAIQRLMEKGYGFGAEGDWKTAAMVRLMKIMTAGVKDAKGTSMMEDYTYNFVPGKEGILQSHMLEVCPSVADGKIGIKVCPLSMGDREDPARLVFTSKTGPAIATSLIDLGDRFRLIINDVECKKVEKPMPKLPVGSAFWTPQPNLKTGAEAWILAGGAHHTAFSYDLTAEQMGDWAAAMGIEAVYIDKDTNIRDFKNELRWNELAFRK